MPKKPYFKSLDLDWIFYLRVFIRPIEKSNEIRVFTYFRLLVNILFSFFYKRDYKRYSGGLFFVDNTRHYDIAKLIIPRVTGSLVHNNIKRVIENGETVRLTSNIRYNYRMLLNYLPSIIRNEFNRSSYIFNNNLQLSLYALLLYETYFDFLRRNDIKFVVIFTDHSFKNRVLLFAAKKLGIPTVYIPHASISTRFPPLEFDVAFLEGEEMFLKYKEIGEKHGVELNSKIIFSGNLKINSFLKGTNVQNSEKKLLGIASNSLDSNDKITQVLKSILSKVFLLDFTIIFRPHPGQKYECPIISERIILSDSKNEYSLDFINRIDFLISGDSNIVLEAALLKRPVFRLNFSDKLSDTYSFIKNGICPLIENIDELKPYVNQNFNNFIFNDSKLQYYDFSYNKNMDSKEIISGHLKKYL
jgi:hypothetical protein